MVPKLVPPADVLKDHVEETRDDHIDTLIWNYLRDRIDFAEVVTQVKERHPEVVGVIDEEPTAAKVFVVSSPLGW